MFGEAVLMENLMAGLKIGHFIDAASVEEGSNPRPWFKKTEPGAPSVSLYSRDKYRR